MALVVDQSLIELIRDIGSPPPAEGRSAMLVQKSEDGGLSWSSPITVVDQTFAGLHDKQSITADPHDSDFVYAVWDRLDLINGGGPALFARTINGGQSWEDARILYDPGTEAQTLGNQIVILPNGTLLNFFNFIEFLPDSTLRQSLAIKRSANRGETWLPEGPPIIAASLQPIPNLVAPGTNRNIRGGDGLFDVAVDPTYGTIYAVWQDGRFSNVDIESVALSISYDGGLSWSNPVKINKTPGNIPIQNQQAFVPSVAVNKKGRVAITYYDFRLNDNDPRALTDYWAITCQSRKGTGCENARKWKRERRLTKRSFDILTAPDAGGLFLGDYVGLAAAKNQFVSVFATSSPFDPANLFSSRFKKGEKIKKRRQSRFFKKAPHRLKQRSKKKFHYRGSYFSKEWKRY